MECPSPSLERIMVLLAAGDESAETSLWQHHGDAIGRFLRAVNRGLGLPPLADDDIDGLVWDACERIRDAAPGWRADGGAKPWVYARARLEGLLREHAGPPTVPFDELDWAETAPPVAGADDPPAFVVLDRLVRDLDEPVVARLHEALGLVVRREVNRELVLLYAQQQAFGDRAPSHVVSALVGLQPDNVRQIFCRVRQKLVTLALADDHFRPLLALPFLASDNHGDGFDHGAAA